MEQSKKVIICSKKRVLVFPYISAENYLNFIAGLDKCVEELSKDAEELEKYYIDFDRRKSGSYFFVKVPNVNNLFMKRILIDFYVNFFENMKDPVYSLLLQPVSSFWVFEIKLHKEMHSKFFLEYTKFDGFDDIENIRRSERAIIKNPNVCKDPKDTKKIAVEIPNDDEKTEQKFFLFCQKFCNEKALVFENLLNKGE